MSLRLTKEEGIILKHLLIEYNIMKISEREKYLCIIAFRAAKKLFKNTKLLDDIRTAFADYEKSEGCSCCRDIGGHKDAAARLAAFLDVPQYPDGSGFNFSMFATPSKQGV